jgi:hypothetical protein
MLIEEQATLCITAVVILWTDEAGGVLQAKG